MPAKKRPPAPLRSVMDQNKRRPKRVPKPKQAKEEEFDEPKLEGEETEEPELREDVVEEPKLEGDEVEEPEPEGEEAEEPEPEGEKAEEPEPEKKRRKAARKEAEKVEKAEAEQEEPKVQRVLVEMRMPRGLGAAAAMQAASQAASVPDVAATGLQIDPDYTPVPLGPPADASLAQSLDEERQEPVLVRGTIDPKKIPELEAQPNVIKVWFDTEVAPFSAGGTDADDESSEPLIQAAEPAALGDCAIPPCDCDHGTAACSKGSMADVRRYLGVDQIWAQGHRGQGIVIAIVDGGITAKGRTINPNDRDHPRWPGKLIERVIGGWPSDWGTTGVAWGWHGNMTATDALGMAPEARIYDIRISGNAISNALSGFQWAINQHKADGTPHILSNSWGIFRESWDEVYARNPNHPFTRKVVEAINEGILVLFAAGNCGERCPDRRCGGASGDIGPDKSIWGANGHPRVMTVGAANIKNQLIGYSSQGKAALDPNKPDFCSISHFTGFFPCDTGTSAACPVAAGVVALLKQAFPNLSQDAAKQALKKHARNIGPSGWDKHSGSGIIQAKATYVGLGGKITPDCQEYRQRATQARDAYRRTLNRRYLCRYYYYLALYYRCQYRSKKDRRYLCPYYRYAALYYGCLYRTTGNRRYLCLYYRFAAAYYRCLYLATRNRRYRNLYDRYIARYRRCKSRL